HGPDFVIDQPVDRYTAEDHAVWRALCARQAKLLPDPGTGEACQLCGLGFLAFGRFDVKGALGQIDFVNVVKNNFRFEALSVRLKARFSVFLRKSESSCSVAKVRNQIRHSILCVWIMSFWPL
ncbi:MAG: Biopterin-dependent aromatic amino acid hydroxylase, partial [Pseudomonadota bacterium]